MKRTSNRHFPVIMLPILLQVSSSTAKYNFFLSCLYPSNPRSHPSLLALPELISPLSACTTFDHSPSLTSLLTDRLSALHMCLFCYARPTFPHICSHLHTFALLTAFTPPRLCLSRFFLPLLFHPHIYHPALAHSATPLCHLLIIPDSSPLASDRPSTS